MKRYFKCLINESVVCGVCVNTVWFVLFITKSALQTASPVLKLCALVITMFSDKRWCNTTYLVFICKPIALLTDYKLAYLYAEHITPDKGHVLLETCRLLKIYSGLYMITLYLISHHINSLHWQGCGRSFNNMLVHASAPFTCWIFHGIMGYSCN